MTNHSGGLGLAVNTGHLLMIKPFVIALHARVLHSFRRLASSVVQHHMETIMSLSMQMILFSHYKWEQELSN